MKPKTWKKIKKAFVTVVITFMIIALVAPIMFL